MSRDYDYLLKFILVGDADVGKTCLLGRFVADEDWSTRGNTIGVDFGVKNCIVGQHRVKLNLWDTAGQESFRSITRSYYRGCSGVMLIYDVTCRESFEHLRRWCAEVREYAIDNPTVTIIGNKTDLKTRRVVSLAEGLRLSEALGALFFEASAKNDCSSKLSSFFVRAAQTVVDRLEQGEEMRGAQRGLQASSPAAPLTFMTSPCCSS